MTTFRQNQENGKYFESIGLELGQLEQKAFALFSFAANGETKSCGLELGGGVPDDALTHYLLLFQKIFEIFLKKEKLDGKIGSMWQ